MADEISTAMKETDRSMTPRWLLIAGGFHDDGGMDKANAALAEYLVSCGRAVHLVAHRVAPELARDPLVTVDIVPRPLNSYYLGERWLERRGLAAAKALTKQDPTTRVLVNGGNCRWADVNWVHYVHHAWSPVRSAAPRWFRIKSRIDSITARRRERRAINRAKVIISNSALTARDLVEKLKADPEKIHTISLGASASWGPVSNSERSAARLSIAEAGDRPIVIFVGGLGHDDRKGFDCLWSAWKSLCERPDWDARLIVAGGGSRLTHWRKEISSSGYTDHATILGFTNRIPELLAASDLLVSPVRYDSYGLNVQEAVCRGVPALVSSRAGIAERYPHELAEMIIPNPEDVADLSRRLLRWRSRIDQWKEEFQPFARELRAHTWTDMAREIVSVVEGERREVRVTQSSAADRDPIEGIPVFPPVVAEARQSK